MVHPVRVAGVVAVRQRPETAEGFTFLLLEDETGLSNVIVRPAPYEHERAIVRGEPTVIVRGRPQTKGRPLSVT